MSVPVRRKIEVVTEFLDGIGNLDFDGAGQLLAENAIMIMPFVDGMPPLEGRTAITAQMRNVIPQMFERMNFIYDAWYDVRDDADTLIAEYHSECPWKASDGTYKNTYITVFRFTDDKIALYKEYLNPMRMNAFGVSDSDHEAPG
jgi:ketosteroid isomerase-like protein